jgi:hypothetical protein
VPNLCVIQVFFFILIVYLTTKIWFVINLCHQVREQLVSYENAFYYHWFVTRMCMDFVIVGLHGFCNHCFVTSVDFMIIGL